MLCYFSSGCPLTACRLSAVLLFEVISRQPTPEGLDLTSKAVCAHCHRHVLAVLAAVRSLPVACLLCYFSSGCPLTACRLSAVLLFEVISRQPTPDGLDLTSKAVCAHCHRHVLAILAAIRSLPVACLLCYFSSGCPLTACRLSAVLLFEVISRQPTSDGLDLTSKAVCAHCHRHVLAVLAAVRSLPVACLLCYFSRLSADSPHRKAWT
ncbi:hypothetical protein J6590_004201 [Homalodisca vitripennis]|nr:hypothetical protein J6590_004201 [Homalodisca vitripennis]